MKFSELKNRFKNKFAMRVIAGVLMVAVLGSSYGVYQVNAAKTDTETVSSTEENGTEDVKVNAEDDTDKEKLKSQLTQILNSKETQEAGKEETVYLIADASGNVNKTIVSTWLKNPEHADTLKDASELKDIENVKGNEDFTQDGENLTWDAQGNDIFYQGTTTKEPPVTEKITYYLDGKEVTPEELAGASGKVTMRFDYTNHEKVTKTMNGKTCDVYVPFTVVTGMVLDEKFRNIEVTNGQVISDGRNNVVVGIAMPGLQESLGVTEEDFDEDVDFPDYMEVTADVTDFSLDMTLSMASSNLLSKMNVNGNLDLSVLSDTINEMSNASSQLVDGSSELAEGLDTLKNSLAEYSSGVNSLTEGLGALAGSTTALITSVGTLNSSAQSISGGIGALNQAVSTPMTEEEALKVKQQAAQAVDTQMADPNYALNYNTIKALAAQQLQSNPQIQAMVKTYVEQGIIAALRADTTANAAMNQLVGSGMRELEAAKTVMDGTNGAGAFDMTYQQTYNEAMTAFTGTLSASVADTAKTGAENAAGEGAVNGAESAKKQIKDSINTTQSNGYSLVSGAYALAAGTQQAADNMPALSSAMNQLAAGSQALKNGTTQLVSGVSRLEEGSNALADGILAFDEEAVQRIADSYNGDIKDLTERLQAVLDAGSEYDIFTKTADGIEGSVKFVWETASIKADN